MLPSVSEYRRRWSVRSAKERKRQIGSAQAHYAMRNACLTCRSGSFDHCHLLQILEAIQPAPDVLPQTLNGGLYLPIILLVPFSSSCQDPINEGVRDIHYIRLFGRKQLGRCGLETSVVGDLNVSPSGLTFRRRSLVHSTASDTQPHLIARLIQASGSRSISMCTSQLGISQPDFLSWLTSNNVSATTWRYLN